MNSIGTLEAKAKKEIRKSGGLYRGMRIYVDDDATFRSFALRVFLANLLVKRTDILFTQEPENAVVFSPETLEETANALFENVCKGTVGEYITSVKGRVTPFAGAGDFEVFTYAKHFGWKLPLAKISTPERIFLERFNVDHPSTLYALKNITESLKSMELKNE